ncbi:molybdopterin molybdenumtransferase MoeA [Candidatus Woesearchaeota archaeon]|nr:molybdopterin molybdenumtransferase MoeA [Candidatus Woesearchaeota archaeon]
MVKQGFKKLTPLREAIKLINEIKVSIENEVLSVDDSLGRVASQDIISKISVPHFDKSAMDGYAVNAEDTYDASFEKPKELVIIDEISAGELSKKELRKGEAIGITTGTPMPRGANSVVMVEYTERKAQKIKVYKSVAPNNNVIRIGSDVKKDDVILRRGEVITERNIGLLTATGNKQISLYKKPAITYFSTGDEILSVEQELVPGKIYDINTTSICAAIKKEGCEVLSLDIISDELERIKDALLEGVENSDLVLLSGGSSLGVEDYMVEAVSELGEVLVHGISVKPGKPVLIGKIRNTPVIGLPGHPTSALSTFYILVRPVINNMLSRKEKKVVVSKKLSRKTASTIGRYEFIPVRIENTHATPIMRGSSSITSLSLADGFIEADENTEVLEKNQDVEVTLF